MLSIPPMIQLTCSLRVNRTPSRGRWRMKFRTRLIFSSTSDRRSDSETTLAKRFAAILGAVKSASEGRLCFAHEVRNTSVLAINHPEEINRLPTCLFMSTPAVIVGPVPILHGPDGTSHPETVHPFSFLRTRSRYSPGSLPREPITAGCSCKRADHLTTPGPRTFSDQGPINQKSVYLSALPANPIHSAVCGSSCRVDSPRDVLYCFEPLF